MPRRSTAPLVILSVAALGAALGVPGCAWLRDEAPLGDDEVLRLIATYPADGEVTDPLAGVDFCFSRLIDPRSLGAFDGILSSGGPVFDSTFELQLVPWRPPSGAPEGASPTGWCPGSVLSVRPRSPLRDDARYRVQLVPTAIGWEGEPIDLNDDAWQQNDDGVWVTWVEFTARLPDDPPDEGAPPEPITLGDLFALGGPFDRQRDLCSCHAEDDALARQRLDLSSADAAFADLVLDTTAGSTGYPTVTPGRPSESFLIHKLLRSPEGGPLHAVRGAAMPMDGPLDDADLVAIARWIDDGAAR
ncbi:MAG: hypothetical protein R3B09_05315 [Nannocystaceae bacterium]